MFSSLGFSKTYIIRMKKSVGLQTSSLRSYLGGVKIKRLDLSFGNFYLVSIKTKSQINQLKKLTKSKHFISVDRNTKIQINPITHKDSYIKRSKRSNRRGIDDTLFKDQWALKNTGDNAASRKVPVGVKGMDLNALKAWKNNKGDRKIKIAIVDTGLNATHKDLAPNTFINEAEAKGADGVDDDGNGFIDDVYGYDFYNNDGDPKDDHAHGSHCAGIIGAAHNDLGIRGLMSNVQMIGLKAFSGSGSGSLAGILKSIDYALKSKVDIISNSWGSSSNPSSAFQAAVDAAEKQGVLFIKAAGNSNGNNDVVGNDSNLKNPNVIIVGAHNGKGEKSYFSSYGKKNVHVFAPGSAILSTVLGTGYEKFSGTSMATPYVAALAGLIKSSEPNLTAPEIRDRIINTSVSSGNLGKYSVSKGRVDAHRALNNITK